MSLKNIANTDMTLDVKEAPTTSATLTVVTSASTKVKCGDGSIGSLRGVYRGNVVVNVTNAFDGTYSQFPVAPVPATVTPTATKTKADGLAVLRVDDEAAQLSIPGLDGGGNPGTILVTVYVKTAGQSKAKAQ